MIMTKYGQYIVIIDILFPRLPRKLRSYGKINLSLTEISPVVRRDLGRRENLCSHMNAIILLQQFLNKPRSRLEKCRKVFPLTEEIFIHMNSSLDRNFVSMLSTSERVSTQVRHQEISHQRFLFLFTSLLRKVSLEEDLLPKFLLSEVLLL